MTKMPTKKTPTEKITGTANAAKYLGCSRAYFAREYRRWANDGIMSWPVSFGKAIVFEVSELDKVFDHHRLVRG